LKKANNDQADPHPEGGRRFLGRSVSFDSRPGEASSQRLCGVVERADYIGRTVRGGIPDYRLTIRGDSGKTMVVSLVENDVRPKKNN
jgi:hypothetical protein